MWQLVSPQGLGAERLLGGDPQNPEVQTGPGDLDVVSVVFAGLQDQP